MAITWSIDKITTLPKCGDLQNVVTDVDWRCTASEGAASHATYGRVSFVSYDEEQFVAYDDLTEDAVVEWVKAALGEASVAYNEELARQRVDGILNPIKKDTELPW